VWGAKNFRNFPWRPDHDPYRTLITEVLLRQTNAARVEPVRTKFLARYPNPKQLGAANHRAVRHIVMRLGFGKQRTPQLIALGRELHALGRAPRTTAALRRLPGVGSYTAAAVACFAFGAREPALDVNVARIVARVYGIHPERGELRKNPTIKRAASDLVCGPVPRRVNWALLDLGALVCKPRPLCPVCPLRKGCAYALTLS
jgi:A/G-specific adenine glycosylase